jgi:uncharacterized membrane protein
VRWWRFALGGALLAWVLATAYRRARERDRKLGSAVLLVGAAIAMFAASALAPRPPMTITLAAVLVVGSTAALAGAIAVVLSKGFGK